MCPLSQVKRVLRQSIPDMPGIVYRFAQAAFSYIKERTAFVQKRVRAPPSRLTGIC